MLNTFERASHKRNPVALLAMMLCTWDAHAAEADAPLFSFSGFGTLGVVHSSEDQADFTSTPFKPNGAGYTHAWSADVDSVLGAQVTANFTSQLSAVVQVISQQDFDNSYRPKVQWANIKYQFTPDFDIRVGRTALPIFMVSDSRDIGFANPWVRPPPEVYSLVPNTSNDGVDATYRMTIGGGTNTMQVTVGQSDSSFPASAGGQFTASSREQVTFVDTFERGFTTFRVNYGQADVTIPQLDGLFDAFRQFGPQGVAIADKYAEHDRLVTYLGMSASYDPGPWFVTGELGRINTRSALGAKTGWYSTAGYRFGKFTPYATYGQVNADTNRSDPGLAVSALPPSAAQAAAGLNAALNQILGSIAVQNTTSLGVRWDFRQNAAFKLQFGRVRLGAGSAGNMVNPQPDFRPGSKLNVFSASMDFVF